MDAASLQSSGWKELKTSGFTASLGPFWVRGSGASREVGFIAETRHANTHLGTVHGGVLMSFADIALGYAVVDALGHQGCATVQLQLQFVALARIGELVSCRAELIRRSAHLAFVRGLICTGDITVASADGVWKVLEPRTA